VVRGGFSVFCWKWPVDERYRYAAAAAQGDPLASEALQRLRAQQLRWRGEAVE
jgi:hypothetical protein